MEWVKLLAPDRKRSPSSASKEQVRTSFEQDFDRIIFSQPFRKLQDKTQVFPLPEDDFVHTRLTHSLEVSSVGRSLGKKVGELLLGYHKELSEMGITAGDCGAIVACASLAHDVGNPPFGHSGEQAISEYFKSGKGSAFKDSVNEAEWEDLISFEGNAQGFRILKEDSMRLTFPVLGAFSKYPVESGLKSMDDARRSQKKYGFFQSEKAFFSEVAKELGLRPLEAGNKLAWCRHPLAFLVEAADDICYHIIDLEDGCTLGLVSEQETSQLLIEILGSTFNQDKYNKIPSQKQRIGTLRALTINHLIEEVYGVFQVKADEILAGIFDQPLVDQIDSRDVMKEIIDLSVRKLYRSRPVLQIEAAGFEVLSGLLEAFSMAMVDMFHQSYNSPRSRTLCQLIPETYYVGLSNKSTTYEILRSCIDFISSMTDSYAISTYRRIKGISLPGFKP